MLGELELRAVSRAFEVAKQRYDADVKRDHHLVVKTLLAKKARGKSARVICAREILAADCGMSYRHLFDVMQDLRAWKIYDWKSGGIVRRKNGLKRYANEYFVGGLLADELVKVEEHLAALKTIARDLDGGQTGLVDGEHATCSPSSKPLAIAKSRAFKVAHGLCSENGWSGARLVRALAVAIEFQAKRMPEISLEAVGEWLVKAYRSHRLSHEKFAVGPEKFFAEARYGSDSAKTICKPHNPADALIKQQMAETGMSQDELRALFAVGSRVKQ